ncbi:MAG: hypothetical protein HY973_04570 [Candidatus Kerfeldbacteria bacterium]|nr:hypothetical protein [Candidatus Kerfeldbacteria bacterium]
MSNFLEKFKNEIAYQKVSKGEGTGPISRILSNVNILVLVFLLVTLFKAQFYWPVLLLLVVGFTRFGHWVSIGLLIYFVISQYWTGVFIMAIYGAIGWISVWYGMKNIKKNLYSGKVKVDPFEGMWSLLLLLIFQVAFFALALFTSGILSFVFWILFGLVTLSEVGCFYHRLASPWRQLLYPLMVRYAAVVGYQSGIAQKENKEFDMEAAINEFAKVIYPDLTDEEIQKFLKTIDEKMNSFADKDNLRVFLKKINAQIEDKKIGDLLGKVQGHFKKKNPRWVIAEVVERDYGVDERVKYLYSLFAGEAV